MSVNLNPIFPLVPVIGITRLSSANNARDGSGVISTLITGSTYGTKVDRITFITSDASVSTNSAMVGRIFISDPSGLNYRLYTEINISSVAASDTSIGSKNQIITGGLIIPFGTLIGAAISVYAGIQDQIDVIAEGGNY